jgi:CYTH domain-containing protein
MEKVKRIIDKKSSDKLEYIHQQLESYFGMTRDEYLTTRTKNLVRIRFIGCYLAVKIENIDIELAAMSFGRDRTSMYHMLRQVEIWLEYKTSHPIDYEAFSTFIDFYKSYNSGEIRVYLVDDEDDDEMSDDEFILHAEATGKVYSLNGFEQAYNNREFVYTNYTIRILKV